MPPEPDPGSKTWHVRCRHDLGLSHLPFLFFTFGVYVMYISIFLHMLMYKDVGKVMFLHPCVHAPLAVVSWGS
jgi:hypothetical protein